MGRWQRWVVLLGVVVLAPEVRAAPAQAFPEWKGEYFQDKEGALYVRARYKGFKGPMTGNVQVEAYSILQRRSYVLSVSPGDPAGFPRQIWKGPSGKYQIRSITVVDPRGVKRTWTGDQTFLIKRLNLSNLGVWTISPKGGKGLNVSFGMAPNTYKEEGSRKESSIAAVIDGFTGLVQERLAGKKLYKDAEKNFESEGQLRATVKFTRQIAMFYKLNLFKHNHFAKDVATVLSVYDPNLRKCYTDRLEWVEGLRGSVRFNFILSKTTGTMGKLKASGGTIRDPKMIECLYYELAAIQFPVRETMLGEVEYTFDVR